jgi:cation diffusion facilitator family transporter
VNYALRPADADHRYGHGKAEALAGLGQALFIGLSAGLVGVHGVERFLNPQPLSTPTLGVLVMLVSLLLTGALLAFQHRVVRITGSTAIRADSLHYRSDLLLNGSILLALVLASFGWSQVDALFGIAIAFFILWSAVGIAREACAVLMDQELAAELSERMLLLACGVDGVVGAHDLRTRRSGMHWFVQLHVEIPGELSLQQAHELCEQVENAIRGEFAQAEVLVHADPLEVVKR